LRIGQNVTFSVDAYLDRAFTGRIAQIRKSPHTKESVVTYTVVAAAKNDDLLLFPGMTAKADIITGDVPDALQVPSAALRYRPQGIPQPSGSHVWVRAGGSIHPVAVRVGVSNEGMTEIVGGDLSEGGDGRGWGRRRSSGRLPCHRFASALGQCRGLVRTAGAG
jgi:HlyD family secretion protein